MSHFSAARLAVALALVAAGCGGSGGTTPTPGVTPTPTPVPTPTPTPSPVTHCSPLPPPVTRWNVKLSYKNPNYWIVDSTPLVGPSVEYCAAIGFTDGRSICPVRQEGDPLRPDCEAYAVGNARDTGRPGPTWTLDGHLCTGPSSGCQNSDINQFEVWAYNGGLYEACATNYACGDLQLEK